MKVDGISKREWFAGMALQGMLCNGWVPDKYYKRPDLVKVAYAIADDMIEASEIDGRLHGDTE